MPLDMIDVAEAQLQVDQYARPTSPVTIPVDAALGTVLAEDVRSDVDSPPHDKAMVDGYAVVDADLGAAQAELTVLEEVTAGEVPTQEVRSGSATRIMTGAPIPQGADAVVMVEQTELCDDGRRVRIRIDGDQRRSNMSSVQPAAWGVMTTFPSSWKGKREGRTSGPPASG